MSKKAETAMEPEPAVPEPDVESSVVQLRVISLPLTGANATEESIITIVTETITTFGLVSNPIFP